MAVRSPGPSHWPAERLPESDHGPAEGRAERWANWLLIYLAALMSSLAVGGAAWALGLAG